MSDIQQELRRDFYRQQAWIALNGSSADAKRVTDATTRHIAGDPECTRSMLRWSRKQRDRMTRERIAAIRDAR